MNTQILSRKEFRKKSALSFLIFFLCMGLGAGAFNFLRSQPESDGVVIPFRKVLEFNAALNERLMNPNRLEAKISAPARGKKARTNGDLGLTSPIDLATWRLQVLTPGNSEQAPIEMNLTLDEIKNLPRTEITTDFKCIEGWSEEMSFAGLRFKDFLEHYHLGTHSGQALDLENRPQDAYKYVGLETPDGQYYVSMDMKSLLHPNTLLAYEQNGEALTEFHGAPLRLYAPNKYGVKSLKRIGRIFFSDIRPPDYWGENGYDYFIGL